MFQILTVLSSLPLARLLLKELKFIARELTSPKCPVRVVIDVKLRKYIYPPNPNSTIAPPTSSLLFHWIFGGATVASKADGGATVASKADGGL